MTAATSSSVFEAEQRSISPQEEEEEKEEGVDEKETEEGSAVEDDDIILVSCRCESAKVVATLLQCLRYVASDGEQSGSDSFSTSIKSSSMSREIVHSQLGNNSNNITNSSSSSNSKCAMQIQPVTVFCSASSLTFHIHGKAKQVQASCDLQSSLFSHYHVVASEVHPKDDWHGEAGGEFCVNLTKVLECLQVVGSSSSNTLERTQLSFSYNSTTEILCLELLEPDTGLLVTVAIPGLVPPEDDLGNSLALAFRSSPMASRLIVASHALKEMIIELELVSGATQGTVSLDLKGLEMATVGHFGECVVSIPPKGRHVIALETHFEEALVPKPRKYPLRSLLAAMRGLDIAQETCITINTTGMMAIQHQVFDATGGRNGDPNFVDFILCCMDNEENDPEINEAHETTSQALLSPNEFAWQSSRPTQARCGACHSDDESAENEDDETISRQSMQSSIPLFGSLVDSNILPSTASTVSPSAADRASRSETSPETRWKSKKRQRVVNRRVFSTKTSRREALTADTSGINLRHRRAPLPTVGDSVDGNGKKEEQEEEEEEKDGGDENRQPHSLSVRDDEDDDHSTSLLQGNDIGSNANIRHGVEIGSDDCRENSQQFDFTEHATRSRSTRYRRRSSAQHATSSEDYCSSPELVYGRQA